MRGLKRLVAVAVVVAACARMAAPPGGPPRRTPPVLISSYPDSGVASCLYRGAAEFRFDEVTSDAGEPNFGYGGGALEKLVLFSPDTAVPSVEWHRDRITVRPRGGWLPHTTYRVELLPGVLDLHQNISKSGSVIAFTTCGPKPSHTLAGRAIDWSSTRGLSGALIEAYHLPDSSRYRTVADSTGRFKLEFLPDGPYLVGATSDVNRDHRRNSGEGWDTVRVTAASDTVGEIWTFARDTLPPKILDITRVDSQAISVSFTKPIDPGLRLDTASVRVGLLPDTISIGILEVLPKAYYDSTHKTVTVRTPAADSTFRVDSLRNDSIAKANPVKVDSSAARRAPPLDLPLQKRPVLGNVIIIRTRGQVKADQSYYVELRNVRTAGGQMGPPVGKTLLKPKPPSAADSARMKADSLKARLHADSLKADSVKVRLRTDSLKADSIKKAKPDSGKVIKPR